MSSNGIKLERIEGGKNVSCDFSESHSFPGANDKIRKQHHPSREVAYGGRKNLRGIGGFAGGVRKALYPLAVNIAHGQQEDSTEDVREDRSQRATTAKPIVHENEPSGADHGPESESEIVV